MSQITKDILTIRKFQIRTILGFFWQQALEPYYPLNWTNPAYHCPGYKGSISCEWAVAGVASHNIGSYAYNAFGAAPASWPHLGLGGPFGQDALVFQYGQYTLREDAVAAPSELFACAESRTWLAPEHPDMQGPANDLLRCGLVSSTVYLSNWGYPSRHGKNYNVVFCDAHVTGMAPTVLFNPTNTAALWNNDHKPHPEAWPQ